MGLFTSFLLQGPHKAPQHAAELVALTQEAGRGVTPGEPKLFGEYEVSLQFFQRPLRDA